METISKTVLLLWLLALNATAYAQQWQAGLSGYFDAVRNNQTASAPGSVFSDPDRLSVLNYLTPLLSDSSHAVRIRACELVHRLANTSRDAGIRRKGVDMLVRACTENNSALTYLKAFGRADFSPQAKENLKSLVPAGHPHLKELLKMAAFLQLRELIPQLRIFASPGNRPAIRWAALISLARMGDDGAASEMMERIRKLPLNDDVVYNIYPDLVFSRNPAAISHMVDIIHSDEKKCLPADAEKEIMIPCGYRVMEQLAPIIREFPLELDESGDLNTTDYPASLTLVRQWFLQNTPYNIIDETY